MKYKNYLLLILFFSCSNPDYLEMRREALINFHNEDYQNAISLIDKILKNEPQDTSYILLMGKCYLALDNDQKAIEFINQAIDLDNSYSDAYAQRAIYYSKVPNYENAILDIREAIALLPKSSNNYFIKSAIEKEAGLIDSAIVTLTKLAQLTPKNMDVFNQRAYLHMRNKDYDLANIDLTKVIESGNIDISALINRGFSLMQLEKYEVAKKDFINAKDLAESDSQLSIILNNIGFAELMLDNIEDAQKSISKAIRLDDQNSYAYKNLARLNIIKSDFEKACELLNKSLERGFTELYGNEVLIMKKEYCED